MRCGRSPATSTGCRNGIPPSPSRASRAIGRPTASAASATSACATAALIREQLLTLSDYDYQCSYSILKSPMGVANYVATLKFTPVTDGNRTFAEWSAEFDAPPAQERKLAEDIGQGVFQAGFDALKSYFGRR